MILEANELDADAVARRFGWKLEPQGACRGDVCVPLSDEHRRDGRALAERLGMAVVADERRGLVALGPEAGGPALASAELPDLELPDRHGRPFSLRSLRGTRFVMIAWASW